MSSCLGSCYIHEEKFAPSSDESDDMQIFATQPSPSPSIDYTKLDLKFRNTYILRLGSSPTTERYLPGVYDKPDNSYVSWRDGSYESTLAHKGLPLKNVVHNSLIEQYKYAFELGYKPSIDCEFKAEDPHTFGSISHITANFNLPELKLATNLLLPKLGSSEPAFDFIATDEKTTKFIISDSGLYNVLSLLKVGGIAIFTHIDENYGWQFDSLAMAPKLLIEDWTSKIKPRYNSAGIGLLDYIFDKQDGKVVDFHDLKLHIQFCRSIHVISSNALKIQFLHTPESTAPNDISDLFNIYRYILRLGNPNIFLNPCDKSYSRMLVIERIG